MAKVTGRMQLRRVLVAFLLVAAGVSWSSPAEAQIAAPRRNIEWEFLRAVNHNDDKIAEVRVSSHRQRKRVIRCRTKAFSDGSRIGRADTFRGLFKPGASHKFLFVLDNARSADDFKTRCAVVR